MKSFHLTHLLFLFTILFFSSCGSIIKDRTDFKVESSEKKSVIFLDDTKLDANGIADPSEFSGSIAAKVESETHKTEYDALIKNKNSIGYLLSYLTYVFYLDGNPVQYDQYYQIQMQHEKKIRTESQRFINIDKISINVKGEDFESQNMSYARYCKDMEDGELTRKSSIFSKLSSYTKDINYDNSIYADMVNKELISLGFIDTSGSFLNSKYNTLNLEAELSKIHMYFININNIESFIISEADLSWKLKDGIDNELIKLNTTSKSGKFLYTQKFFTNDIRYIIQAANVKSRPIQEAIENSINDAILTSIYDFLDSKKVQKILNEKMEEEVIEESIITKPKQKVSSISEAVTSTVTVKVDEGHGSGFFINNEGYILTNHHVINDTKNINVLHNGKEYKAELIKSAKLADLALLKIDLKNEFSFELPSEQFGKLGSDVYAIGTPNSLDLSATLSKGIISGFRDSNTNRLMQTDVSINFGNSGGPLTDVDGNLVGIVNSKLAGFGVEGISFGLSAEEIFKNLNLSYSK